MNAGAPGFTKMRALAVAGLVAATVVGYQATKSEPTDSVTLRDGNSYNVDTSTYRGYGDDIKAICTIVPADAREAAQWQANEATTPLLGQSGRVNLYLENGAWFPHNRGLQSTEVDVAQTACHETYNHGDHLTVTPSTWYFIHGG
jgi:hypothetical protein